MNAKYKHKKGNKDNETIKFKKIKNRKLKPSSLKITN